MSENIIAQLKSQYEYFTRVEKQIADLVLDDPHKFVTYSTARVAELCNVSQGSINNFAKKFAPDGFSFFKLSIARCVAGGYNEEEIEIPENSGEIMKNMSLKVREYISALCHTLEVNDDESVKSAADKIMSAKRVEIFGVFQSGIVAKNFSYKLIQLGISSRYENDSLMIGVSASTLTDKDVVIAISASGTTKNIVDAVTVAKQNNAFIVGITSNKFSPLAKLSDTVLITPFGKGKTRNKLDNVRISQLLIIDTLYTCLRKTIDPSDKKFDNISKILFSDGANL